MDVEKLRLQSIAETIFFNKKMIITIDTDTENPVETWIYLHDELVDLLGSAENKDKPYTYRLLKCLRPSYETAKKMVI